MALLWEMASWLYNWGKGFWGEAWDSLAEQVYNEVKSSLNNWMQEVCGYIDL